MTTTVFYFRRIPSFNMTTYILRPENSSVSFRTKTLSKCLDKVSIYLPRFVKPSVSLSYQEFDKSQTLRILVVYFRYLRKELLFSTGVYGAKHKLKSLKFLGNLEQTPKGP